MNVTITAKGYAGIKGEVTEVRETGAVVAIERAGIDLAPRNVFFVFEALKGVSAADYVAPEPETSEVRKGDAVSVATGTGIATDDEYVAADGRSRVWVRMDGATKNAHRRFLVSKVTKI